MDYIIREMRSEEYCLLSVFLYEAIVKVKSFAPRQIQRRSFAALAITLSRKIF